MKIIRIKHKVIFLTILLTALLPSFIHLERNPVEINVAQVSEASSIKPSLSTYSDKVKKGETLSIIFDSNGLGPETLTPVLRSARKIYNLARIKAGRPYTITLTPDNIFHEFRYQHKEDAELSVKLESGKFQAEEIDFLYERRTSHIGGVIGSNLVSSIDSLSLALELSDVFAWDIDFATGLRTGDTFKAVVETLYRDNKFVRYGKILAAEFINDRRTYRAYLFAPPGESSKNGYYTQKGRSIRRAFLKAPLTYRRISSGYSYGRYHPILKKVRPHLAIDYAAPRGTPVSTVGDGEVSFAGWKGANGNLVVIKHAGSYTSSYGHLQKIARGIKKNRKVSQGQVIGWVGSTGRSTGPHLDYRVKQGGRAINPAKLVMPRGKAVLGEDMQIFALHRDEMDLRLSSIITGATLVARTESR
jgi:murein DD-endopeptidase MepM/ murein hydrolase activator NlpD